MAWPVGPRIKFQPLDLDDLAPRSPQPGSKSRAFDLEGPRRTALNAVAAHFVISLDYDYWHDVPPTAKDFLAAAVPFANERVWGNLSCTSLVHPKTQASHGPLIESAISDLRYGTVCINAWTALGF